MIDDDFPRGYVLTRREMVALLGATGFATLSGCSPAAGQGGASTSPDCVVRPAQTEGPYFVDERLNRADLRSDPSDGAISPGIPLALTLVVSRMAAGRCDPLAGVLVDLWHCDHAGVYSDVVDPSFDTVGKKFLRGYQVTDAAGTARFTTIYPGWYAGRTVHIHFKLRSPPDQKPGFEFTSQFYFDDAQSDRVFARAPYAGRGNRSYRNQDDEIFRDGGSQLMLPLTAQGEGLAGSFHVGLQSAG
jgi:protocatechuate 3,4-dioxygenase beta subunit